MAYIDPNKVHSPKRFWSLVQVLRNDGDGDASLALGKWDNDDGEGPSFCLAARWNGSSEEDGVGSPQSRGLPTWFIFPEWMNESILNGGLIAKKDIAWVTTKLEN